MVGRCRWSAISPAGLQRQKVGHQFPTVFGHERLRVELYPAQGPAPMLQPHDHAVLGMGQGHERIRIHDHLQGMVTGDHKGRWKSGHDPQPRVA